MKIFFDLLAYPEKTLNAPDISKRLNILVGILAVLVITTADFILMFKIGHVEGGNPCLWFIIGGMLDLDWVQALSPTMKWVILYPIKIVGDAGLVLLPAWIAVRFFGAGRSQVYLWARAYCHLVLVLDVFLVLAMLPAAFIGTSRALLASNLLSYMVFGANALLYTNAYRCCFKLTFDRAFVGWFVVPVALPMVVISLLFL